MVAVSTVTKPNLVIEPNSENPGGLTAYLAEKALVEHFKNMTIAWNVIGSVTLPTRFNILREPQLRGFNCNELKPNPYCIRKLKIITGLLSPFLEILIFNYAFDWFVMFISVILYICWCFFFCVLFWGPWYFASINNDASSSWDALWCFIYVFNS